MTILSEKNTYINYIGTLINSEGEDISVNQPNYIFNKYTLSGYNSNNGAESLSGNSLRVLFVIYNNDKPVCYTEMYPTNVSNNIFSYNWLFLFCSNSAKFSLYIILTFIN